MCDDCSSRRVSFDSRVAFRFVVVVVCYMVFCVLVCLCFVCVVCGVVIVLFCVVVCVVNLM